MLLTTSIHQPQKLLLLALKRIREMVQHNNGVLHHDKMLIHMFIIFFQSSDDTKVKLEVLKILGQLTNLNEHKKQIVNAGIISHIINILKTCKVVSEKMGQFPVNFDSTQLNMEIVFGALKLLGNVIADNAVYGNLTIELGLIEPLLSFIRDDLSISFQRKITRIILKIVQYREQPLAISIARKLVYGLNQLIRRHRSLAIYAVEALTHIADYGNDYIELIIDSNVIPSTIELFNDMQNKKAAINLIKNLTLGTVSQTQELLDNELLINLRPLLTHHNSSIRLSTLQCISNITSGRDEFQIESIFSCGLLQEIAINLSYKDGNVVREATLVLRNLFMTGKSKHLERLIHNHEILNLYNLLECDDGETVRYAREGIIFLKNSTSIVT